MEIIFAGFGGQGVLTSGLLLANIALKNEYEVMWSPAYGGEMRGGKAYSLVKYERERITEPIATELDMLAAMNGPSLDFCRDLKKGGLLILNSDVITDKDPIPDGFQKIWLPVNTLALESGSMKAANIVSVGLVIRLLKLCDLKTAENVVCDYFESKGKGAFNEGNAAALKAGYNYEIERARF